MSKKFPKVLYVVAEEDSDDGSSYFLESEEPAEFAQIGKKRVVARYNLDGLVTLVGKLEIIDN